MAIHVVKLHIVYHLDNVINSKSSISSYAPHSPFLFPPSSHSVQFLRSTSYRASGGGAMWIQHYNTQTTL